MDDHLARLCLEGAASAGQYTPHAFHLNLRGTDQFTDHVVHLHEIHHAGLNDETAWGTALHVYARLPRTAEDVFNPLLDACRTVHESFATFASVRLAAARHGPIDAVLATYPDYIALYQTVDRLTAGVLGANRRLLAATAMARLCMQGPVLQAMLDTGLDAFRLAGVRAIDRPDDRWRRLVTAGPGIVEDAAAAADRLVAAGLGHAALDADGLDGDLYASTDRSHDEAWDAWERAAYNHLRSRLAGAGATVLDFDAHQEPTARLLELAEQRHGATRLRAAMTDEQRRDDAAVASSVLQQVRHELHGGRRLRAAALAVATEDIVQQLEDPVLILHARPPRRLTQLYRWSPGDLELLRLVAGPVVAVRVLDGEGPDRVVGHAPVAHPDELVDLAGPWHDRGPRLSCVSASCAVDADWVGAWLPGLARLGPVFMLVDVEPDRFVPRWARDGRDVVAVEIDVDTGGTRRTALVFTPDVDAGWWLLLADDVTVRLLLEYLRGRLGARLRLDEAPFEPYREATTALIGHLLATESFTSFDALGATDA